MSFQTVFGLLIFVVFCVLVAGVGILWRELKRIKEEAAESERQAAEARAQLDAERAEVLRWEAIAKKTGEINEQKDDQRKRARDSFDSSLDVVRDLASRKNG